MNGIRWMSTRVMPAIIWAVLIGIGVGWYRFHNGFIIGIQGMLIGVVIGLLNGRLAGRDEPNDWWMGRRIGLALVCMLAYSIGQLIGVGLAQPSFAPLEWMQDLVDDYQEEFMIGVVARSRHVYLDGLSGGWWVFMNLLDGVLMAFLTLVSTGMNIGSKNRKTQPEEVEEETTR